MTRLISAIAKLLALTLSFAETVEASEHPDSRVLTSCLSSFLSLWRMGQGIGSCAGLYHRANAQAEMRMDAGRHLQLCAWGRRSYRQVYRGEWWSSYISAGHRVSIVVVGALYQSSDCVECKQGHMLARNFGFSERGWLPEAFFDDCLQKWQGL